MCGQTWQPQSWILERRAVWKSLYSPQEDRKLQWRRQRLVLKLTGQKKNCNRSAEVHMQWGWKRVSCRPPGVGLKMAVRSYQNAGCMVEQHLKTRSDVGFVHGVCRTKATSRCYWSAEQRWERTKGLNLSLKLMTHYKCLPRNTECTVTSKFSLMLTPHSILQVWPCRTAIKTFPLLHGQNTCRNELVDFEHTPACRLSSDQHWHSVSVDTQLNMDQLLLPGNVK